MSPICTLTAALASAGRTRKKVKIRFARPRLKEKTTMYITPFQCGLIVGGIIGGLMMMLMDAYSGWKLMIKQQKEMDR